MKPSTGKFWPFSRRSSVLTAPILLVFLLVLAAAFRWVAGWPSESSETIVLAGVILLSLTPILLALIDVVADLGAVIEYKGVKLDFSRIAATGSAPLKVPVNIGVPGRAVMDSDTSQILDTLRQATATEVVIIDLEQGQAWWETRLLVLLAGAVRLGKPEIVVFLGTEGGAAGRFQGWASARDLLPLLLQADPRYKESYHRAMAAAHQWALVEPVPAGVYPQAPSWASGLATQHSWMAFDSSTGLPNDLAAEQFLAADLGQTIENLQRSRGITLARLEELFRPVLHTESLDETWADERQLEAFLDSSSTYLALTRKGSYVMLLPRQMGLNEIIKSLVKQRQERYA